MKAHLGSFRKGWQSENLARFILYKFSFVAHPATTADDVGSDFFCTLFQTLRENGKEYLLPRSSFAIQVKSNVNRINVSNQLEYLKSLEIPFFVGIVDREALKMTIYSGEYIPALAYSQAQHLSRSIDRICSKGWRRLSSILSGSIKITEIGLLKRNSEPMNISFVNWKALNSSTSHCQAL